MIHGCVFEGVFIKKGGHPFIVYDVTGIAYTIDKVIKEEESF